MTKHFIVKDRAGNNYLLVPQTLTLEEIKRIMGSGVSPFNYGNWYPYIAVPRDNP